MWTDERATFWCGAQRYIFVDAASSHPQEGLIEGIHAEHLIADALAQGGGWQVLEAFQAVARTRRDACLEACEFLGWIGSELRDGSLRLHVVEQGGGARKKVAPSTRPTPAQEIVESFVLRGIRHFIYRAQRLTIILQAEVNPTTQRETHELVAPKEAHAILQAIAKDPQTPILRRTLFADASKVALPSAPPDPRHQLALLRERKVFVQERELRPPLTPSQLKQAMSRASRAPIDEKSWIEVELVFDDGSPANGYSYRFSLAGQPPKAGQVSDGHEMGYYQVDEGEASLRVWKPKAAASMKTAAGTSPVGTSANSSGPTGTSAESTSTSDNPEDSDELAADPEAPATNGVVVRLTGLNFELEKSLPLPAAIPGIRKLAQVYRDHPHAEVLVVGHTDASGSADYNRQLSLERAQAVCAYLTDNVDAWLANYGSNMAAEKRWGASEDRHMLTALPVEGPAFARPGVAMSTAVREFQKAAGLVVDGIAGPKTRRALIQQYMAQDQTTLPAGTVLVPHG